MAQNKKHVQHINASLDDKNTQKLSKKIIHNYNYPKYYETKANIDIPESEFVHLVTSTIRNSFVANSSDNKVMINNLLVLNICRDILISHNFNDYCVDILHDALSETCMYNGIPYKCMSKQQLHWLFSQLKYIYNNAIPYTWIDKNATFNSIQSCTNDNMDKNYFTYYSRFDIALCGLYLNGTGHKSHSQFYNNTLNKLHKYIDDNNKLSLIDIIHDRTEKFLKMRHIHHDYIKDYDIKPTMHNIIHDNCNHTKNKSNKDNITTTNTINNNDEYLSEIYEILSKYFDKNELENIKNSTKEKIAIMLYTTIKQLKEIDNLVHIVNKKVDYLVHRAKKNNK